MRASIAATLATLLVLTLASEALALDAWRDRRGLFVGVGVGAGSGQSDVEGAEAPLGFNLDARIGGGVSKELTLDADLTVQRSSYDVSGIDISQQIFTGMIGANFFVHDGLYLRGMGGVSHISVDPDPGAEDSETGTGLGLGVGYEFFATADLAVGLGGDFRYLIFENFDFTMINFGVTGTWY